MDKIINFIFKHKYIFFISAIYFFFRFINLTLLPIFNDESIYLDWGWRETHVPGYLFYSLYDAKQPLLMWLFGISESIFTNQLFAGRIISILTGFFTMLGLYKLSKDLFSTRAALLVSILYIVIPIFSFYDRQALMESAAGSVGVWTLYFYIRYNDTYKKKYATWAGILLGTGFLIKSSAAIFIFALILIELFRYATNSSARLFIFEFLKRVILSFTIVNIILFIQPMYWQTLSSNSRYSFGAMELLHFPLKSWAYNLAGDMQIILIYLSAPIFALAVLGFIFLLRCKNKNYKLLSMFVLLTFLLQIIIVRSTSQRYLVSFLPPFCLIAVSPLRYLHKKNISIKHVMFSAAIVILPLSLTILQLLNPSYYILSQKNIGSYSDMTYVDGYTSGYGLGNVFSIIDKRSFHKVILVGIAENTGNPESAIIDYFHKSNNVHVTYFDSRLFGNALRGVSCIDAVFPTYFISRDNQLAGLDQYFTKLSIVKNPYGSNFIGIYILRKNCQGKKLRLSFNHETYE